MSTESKQSAAANLNNSACDNFNPQTLGAAHISLTLATYQTQLQYLEEKKLLYYAQSAAERLAQLTEQARLRYVACLLADYDVAWMEKIAHLIDADEASQNHALTEAEFMILDDAANELRRARKTLTEPTISARLLNGLGNIFTKYAAALKRGPDYPEPEGPDVHGHVDDLGKPDYEEMIKLMLAANAPAVAPSPDAGEKKPGSGTLPRLWLWL